MSIKFRGNFVHQKLDVIEDKHVIKLICNMNLRKKKNTQPGRNMGFRQQWAKKYNVVDTNQ